MIKNYELEIEGIENSPLIWNVPKAELMEEYMKLNKSNEIDEWEKRIWKEKAEYDKNNNLIIPPRWLHASLLNAAMKSQMKPHYDSDKRKTYTNYIKHFMIRFNMNGMGKIDNLKCFKAFRKSNPNSFKSGRVWRLRPMLEKWKASFTVSDPLGRMSIEELRTLVEYAGLYLGIGDEHNLGCGRFTINKLEEIDNG